MHFNKVGRLKSATGLRTSDEHVSGVHNDGRAYIAIARKYRPDHLAILLNERGACSIQDGCGVLNCLFTGDKPKPARWSSLGGVPPLYSEHRLVARPSFSVQAVH